MIKLNGSAPVNWTVYGRPAVETTTWKPNSYNELGLHVDPADPPSFREFFAGSTAHKDMKVQRLEPSGRWAAVSSTTAIRAGEAYRIYSAGSRRMRGRS